MQVVDIKDVEKKDATGVPMFIGHVGVQIPLDPKSVEDVNFGLISFSPGARTKLHTHNKEQILIITEGEGIVATKDKEYKATPGMVYYIPAGEAHWHGGGKETSLKHFSIISPVADGVIQE